MNSAIRRNLILITLAILGALAFHYAPPSIKTYSILPRDPSEPLPLETFSDSGVTGTSKISMDQSSEALHLDILLNAPEGKDSWAGIGWTLTDANWMFMDTLYVKIRGTGVSEAQLKLLTFDPDHTDPTNRDTYRQVLKEIPVTSAWTTLAIPTEQLYVPEWWYQQQKVARDLDSKHLEQVFRFDFLPAANSPRNAPISIDIASITASGTSSRNLALLLGYWFILMIFAIGANPNKESKK